MLIQHMAPPDMRSCRLHPLICRSMTSNRNHDRHGQKIQSMYLACTSFPMPAKTTQAAPRKNRDSLLYDYTPFRISSTPATIDDIVRRQTLTMDELLEVVSMASNPTLGQGQQRDRFETLPPHHPRLPIHMNWSEGVCMGTIYVFGRKNPFAFFQFPFVLRKTIRFFRTRRKSPTFCFPE